MDLRNENSVKGKLMKVDGFMNVHMCDVVFTTWDGEESKLEFFYVQGKNIRYVHIPDEVDMLDAIKSQLSVYDNVAGRVERAAKGPNREERKLRAETKMYQRTRRADAAFWDAQKKKEAASNVPSSVDQ